MMENKLINLNNCSEEELQIIQEQAMVLRMKKYEAKLEYVMSELSKTKEEIAIMNEANERTMEAAVNSIRVNQPLVDYVGQKDFGNLFTVSIGSKTVGKLFKIVGLAQKTKGRTTPYRDLIGKYAKVVATTNYSDFKWHYENCLNKIDMWLAENNKRQEFYSKKNEHELEQFINELYIIYVDNPFEKTEDGEWRSY